jgi:hypothetical protein
MTCKSSTSDAIRRQIEELLMLNITLADYAIFMREPMQESLKKEFQPFQPDQRGPDLGEAYFMGLKIYTSRHFAHDYCKVLPIADMFAEFKK